MPASDRAVRMTFMIAHSECAMHCGVAGKILTVIEEDCFVNGKEIPVNERRGCYVVSMDGARIPMLKSEAGWR